MLDPAIQTVSELVQKCTDTISRLFALGIQPQHEKKLARVFTLSETEALVDRSRTTIYAYIAGDRCSFEPLTHDSSGRIRGFTLDNINEMRREFGTAPHRKNGAPCKTIAIQSFKGGVAKSVTTIHLAQYLAIKGYRVLVIDTDPQASATSSFGFVPDNDFEKKDTMFQYFDGRKPSLSYAIQKTYFPGIDLIPSCLAWYEAEFGLFSAATADRGGASEYYTILKEGIDTVSDNYDVVVIDSPPALGMTAINILAAANGVIVPTPASMFDFASTTQYFKMVQNVMVNALPGKRYDFIKVMAAKVERNKSRQMEFLEVMRTRFGFSMLNNMLISTSQIPNAASMFQTLYDIPRGDQDRRVMTDLEALFSEIETLITRDWEESHV